jgi:flavin-dependent dehydrogenase
VTRAGAAAADVVVVGGSIAGLTTALALSRRGVDVLVLEADPAVGPGCTAAAAADPLGEAARRTPRRATPQAGHSHTFLARCRTLLAAEAPDVLDDLREAGVRELVLADSRPATVPVGAAVHPGDDALVAIAARRTTFEAVLRRAVERRADIRVLAGRRATGLQVDAAGAVPLVRGVGTDAGAVAARRLVVDASGRRTPMPGWLSTHGVTVVDDRTDCGITYLTRFYERAPGAPTLPLDRGFTAGGSFDRYSCLVFPADADAFSLTFGVLPEDRALVRSLRDPAAFDAAVAAIPSLAPWTDPAHARPTSEVRVMAGLVNAVRTTGRDGRSALRGWTAVGDAAATTNPAHSRGCTLAAVHAVAVADAVVDHRDPADLAEACAAAVEREQRPWVVDSVEQDAQRLARWRSGAGGDPAPPLPPGRLSNGETFAAARHDASVWRRFTRLQQLFERPDEVLADPRVVARVRAVQAADRTGPSPAAPTRAELTDLLDAVGAATGADAAVA